MENEDLIDQLCMSGHLDLIPVLQTLAEEAQALIEEGFSLEKIQQYSSHLSALKILVACLSSLSDLNRRSDTEPEAITTTKELNVEKLNSTKSQYSSSEKCSVVSGIVNRICWPLLHSLNPTSDTRKEVLILLGKVCELLIECVKCDTSKTLLHSFLEKSLNLIQIYLLEKPSAADTVHDKELIDIYTLTEALRTVLLKSCDENIFDNDSKLQENLSEVFDKYLEVSPLIDVELVGSTIIPLLARILKLLSGRIADKTWKVWDTIKTMMKEISKSRNDDRKIYIILCGLANHLFPVSGVCVGDDLRCNPEFWDLLQAGLLSKDSVNRKRSLYLLKRIVDICETNCHEVNNRVVTDLASVPVFFWSKQRESSLMKIWENVILLLEVFEEKQVHVIKPLLPRMRTLIEATTSNNSDGPLLHTSWLMTMFSRCLHHESIQIIWWSAETVLSLDYTRCPMLHQGQGEFLSGSFLYSLQEPRLFIRDQDATVGSMPEVAERLTHFFPAVWKALSSSERGVFFSKTVQSICTGVWGPIPLVYICRGLTFVPQSPCLDKKTVTGMREFLSGFIVTVDAYIKGAIQCFCVEILLNLTDRSCIPSEEFFHILSLFHSEDCLTRGTTLWSKCSDWLKAGTESKIENWSVDCIQSLIDSSLSKYLETTLDSKFSPGDSARAQQLSRLLLLASDATIATSSSEVQVSTLVMVSEKLAGVINSINSHAYMSTHKADKAIQLLVQLTKDLGLKYSEKSDLVTQTVMKSLYACLSEMEIYMTRQITGALHTLSNIPALNLYCDTVKSVVPLLSETTPVSNFSGLCKACIGVLNRYSSGNLNEKQALSCKLSILAGICMLGAMAATVPKVTQNAPGFNNTSESITRKNTGAMRNMICDFAKEMKPSLQFSKPVDQDLSQQEWGKLVSLYLQSQWDILHFGLDCSDIWCESTELLALAQETLSVCVGQTLVPVLHCFKLILPQVINTQKLDDNQIKVMLEACWTSLEESRRHPHYWQILGAFVEAVFQPCLMMKPDDSEIIQSLNKFASNLVTLGEDRKGVANILVPQLCVTWSRPQATEHVAKFLPLIVDLCMFGNIQKKGDRQIFDVCASIESLGKKCSVNELKDSMSNKDVLVRATVFSFLCGLNPAHTLHRHLVTAIIKLTVERYVELSLNQSLTFVNSLVHRQRHRLVQLLLLTKSFVEADFLASMWQFLWRSLEQEHQPSIRHMLEWQVMWIMYRHSEYSKQIWILFEKYRESKNFVLCSLLCIVIHMGPYLPPEEQEDYYNRAIPNVLPWCLAHHFNTRIFAQATLVKLWAQCEQLGLTNILKAHSILQNLVDFNQGNRNSTKNVRKLLDSFFFKFLDFKRDFSIETLFHTLPCMTGLAVEDWITPSLFIQVKREWGEGKGSCFIQLYNKTDHLRSCDPGLWRWRGGLNSFDDEAADGADDTSVSQTDGSGDVQKKIMPWKQMVPDEETSQEIEYGVKQKQEGGLVVVTSLISKIPNLGGLCRTSEIFGVSEYVLGKLHYTEDKAFQGLSVTAHKWLPITEVHESRLPEYLHQKRQEGYTLVGVEQTANSVCLTDYTFPVKSLLLLGNEKEGIPVDLISLLDVCVEIPQQGVIRSLNVHVSGALLIWEYRRQQLVKMKS